MCHSILIIMKFFILNIFYFLCINCVYSQVTNSIGIDLVKIPAGSFYMGNNGYGENYDEAPVHKVMISKDFFMSSTEITNKQFEEFQPNHKLMRGKYGISKDDNEAVVFVDYNDAVNFCKWLSDKEGKYYRLPTEAEWEYACKSGNYLPYYMDDTLPNEYQKNQQNTWGPGKNINLGVAQSSPNDWGLYDMHGNVEEWCIDWYGAYESYTITNPGGKIDGLYRVTRGGSHSTSIEYLRSTNRLGMLPEDKSWLVGFRIVCDAIPSDSLVYTDIDNVKDIVKQKVMEWDKKIDEPIFMEPIPFVIKPDCDSQIPFYVHNHCPSVTWCDNGDLLAIWFSTNDEEGRESIILSSRLRSGNNSWDAPKVFFKVPDRNMSGSSIYNDGDGRLIFINSVEVAGTWNSLIMVMRISYDNGQTWSRPRIIAPEHEYRNQVISGMFKTKEGWLVQAADATPWGEGGTALHISKDNGRTWVDYSKGISSDFKDGGKGGSIAGIHAGVVQLNDGSFFALGRGNNIKNKDSLLRMPASRSFDGGKTWIYSASEFPPIDGGQRLVLIRLNEGPILFVSFTNHPYRIKDGIKGMSFVDDNGSNFVGYGMFAALSFDEGKTWPVKKLITDGKQRFMNGGAWTGFFEMDATHAEPRGYLTATQTPDGIIHLLSSRNHYRFNLCWLMQNVCSGYDLH